MVKNLSVKQGHAGSIKPGDVGLIPGTGSPPGKGSGIHFSILPWEISGTEEPGGLLSVGLPRVGYD